jgi:putative DNA primase/helicase
VRRARDIPPRAVRWLWRERVPVGMITLVAGRPGSAKSLLAVHIAAKVSHGADVLISAREDPQHEVLRPRLEAAGANLDRVHVDALVLPDDLGQLEDRIIAKKIKPVVLDPIAAHLGGGISRFNDSVRSVSTPLTRIAEQTGAAIVLIDHVVKHVAQRAHPLQAIGGSGSGLPAAARMAFLVGKDPDDDERIIVACVKSVRDQPRALGFVLDSVSYTDAHSREGTAGVLLPQSDEFEFDARKLLVVENGEKRGRPPTKRAAAAEWLAKYLLAAEGHEGPAAEVEEDARQVGITNATLRRAAEDMGVKKTQRERGWWWQLPPEVNRSDGSRRRWGRLRSSLTSRASSSVGGHARS